MEDFQEAKSGRDTNKRGGSKQRGAPKEGNRGGLHYQKKQQHDDSQMKESPVGASPAVTSPPLTQLAKVQEEEKKGGDNKNRNKQSHNKGGAKHGKSHIASIEKGFTGDPETWFDDNQFKKQIT
jgi:hypothetical protein